MNRVALVNALLRRDSASQACAAALTRGADLKVFDEPAASAELVAIYRRRAAHVDAIGLEHDGFEEALAELEACGSAAVHLGQVRDHAEQRHYQLFLSADADDVVACLWVHHEE